MTNFPKLTYLIYFRLIQGVSCCDVTMLLKVWCLAEQFSWSHLSETVLRVIDTKLELFLNEELFLYRGFEEIKSILQRPTLCLRYIIFDVRKYLTANENGYILIYR